MINGLKIDYLKKQLLLNSRKNFLNNSKFDIRDWSKFLLKVLILVTRKSLKRLFQFLKTETLLSYG